jgi:two-component system sensor histidine kinase UhpB
MAPHMDTDAARAQRVSDVYGLARRLFGRPNRLRWMLDAGMVVTFLAVLAHVANSDMLFHVMFVLLTVHAFALGFVSAAIRLAFAFLAVGIDMFLPGGMAPSEFLVEWPLMFMIAAFTLLQAERRQQVVHQYVSLYRRASDRLMTAQEEERRRLAIDLHDGVGQTLTALTLALDSSIRELPAGHRSRHRLERVRDLASMAVAETRDVAQRLRPARLEEIGLAAALRELATHSGIVVDASFDPDVDGRLDVEETIAIFRVAQEALGNVARHSGERYAMLEVVRRDDNLVVSVADRGRGFDPEVEGEHGLGLAGMKERAAMVGGALDVRSSPGKGTTVTLSVPLPRQSVGPPALDPEPVPVGGG